MRRNKTSVELVNMNELDALRILGRVETYLFGTTYGQYNPEHWANVRFTVAIVRSCQNAIREQIAGEIGAELYHTVEI